MTKESLIDRLESLRLTIHNMGYIGMLTGEHIAQNKMLDKCIAITRQRPADHREDNLDMVKAAPDMVERVAYAVCPHIKPWMDDESVEPHPCKGCKPIIDDDGERLHSMCLMEAKTIARVAIQAMGSVQNMGGGLDPRSETGRDASAPESSEPSASITLPPANPSEIRLDKCPKCGGPADNGHDRCYPPNPYYCTKCSIEGGGATESPVDINKLADDIARIVRLQNGKGFCPGVTSNKVGLEVIQEIYPYLRTRKQMSVSRERSMEIIYKNNGGSDEDKLEAVLKDAGISYVD